MLGGVAMISEQVGKVLTDLQEIDSDQNLQNIDIVEVLSSGIR